MKRIERRVVVAAAWVTVAVLAGAALTGVAVAAEQSGAAPTASSPGSSAAPSGAAQRGGGQGLGPAERLRGLGARVVHGEATVRTKDGFQAVDTQLGTVTRLSATSLTARSADGFTQTWTLTADTVVRKDGRKAAASDLAVGDTVRILGPAGSGTAGATARLVAVRPAAGARTSSTGGSAAAPSSTA